MMIIMMIILIVFVMTKLMEIELVITDIVNDIASDCILLAITNITTNGNADDITKIYDSVNKSRLGIASKLKGIARIINNSLDDYECGIIGRDYNDSECNDETKAD